LELVQIMALAFVATLLLTVLRQQRPELAVGLSLAAGILLFLPLVSRIFGLVQFLQELGAKAQVSSGNLSLILRIIGIAYVTEFGAQVCRDAREEALASRVEMAGKVLIMLLALPIVRAVLDLLLRLLA